ncbi:XdhC family protein [Falsirhodobacter halotolerans]|uniref:XdhC family protein n=1 Tax=Falsirhodobacter halotolerans TaxID=1146892 RepID=UPI001FD21C4F|nr:XdhC family protein [Falsirhodobacter halotolerans]MCJ8140169.1 XdhC family protein [Falsirhodobacter halotolerans]
MMDGGHPAPIIALPEGDMPLAALCEDGARLAMIVGVEGPSYRPVGAAMAIGADGRRTGSLSSGCIDQDVALRAEAADRPEVLRYGRGSAFVDLALPCGGGLDVLIVPAPDRAVLSGIAAALRARQAAVLSVGRDGHLATAPQADGLTLRILPEIRHLVFGKGPEAATFASLARTSGYLVEVFSPDVTDMPSDLATTPLLSPGWPDGVAIDDRTAVTLFFHDHDWEPAILTTALASPAFYVGAQGSFQARARRRAALIAAGVPEGQIDRMADPFGTIPSARDARTLAVGVLADVLTAARR